MHTGAPRSQKYTFPIFEGKSLIQPVLTGFNSFLKSAAVFLSDKFVKITMFFRLEDFFVHFYQFLPSIFSVFVTRTAL